MDEKSMNPEEIRLLLELEGYAKGGITICLNGIPSSPYEVARACTIEEENTYMRDYISNERGKVERVNFDRIRQGDLSSV